MTDIKNIIDLYEQFGSVWKVGKQVGLSGQAVHYKLKKLGIDTSRPPEFTESQLNKIIEYYTNTPPNKFHLNKFAEEIGKDPGNISRIAGRLGLSKQGRLHNDETLKKIRGKPKWKDRPHPRGMLGKKHSKENLLVFSANSKKTWATYKAFNIGLMSKENRERRSKIMRTIAINKDPAKSYTRAKGGHRKDLDNIYFRSSWEANYARYLNLLKRLGVVEYWDFEKEIFWFDEIKRGVTNYRPDFRVKYKNDPKLEYVEIKGWTTPKDRTKWRRMKKYYPDIKLVIITQKQYETIKIKWASSIPEWEHPIRNR